LPDTLLPTAVVVVVVVVVVVGGDIAACNMKLITRPPSWPSSLHGVEYLLI
jgi:hypothetical protein